MLAEALWWASQGMPVFPVFEVGADGKCACGPTSDCTERETAGKHPRIGRWQILATTDERQIREWWGRWPSSNIGICCGQELPGGGLLLVVDVDPRHDGDISLSLLEQKYGELPETARNLTGGGGQHYFFRVPRLVKSRSNALGPGVDVKCDRGYVLAPPSSHASGGRYARDAGADLADVGIAAAPAWMLILADPPAPPPKATATGAADAFIEGGRHDAIVSLTGVLRRRGLSAVEMLPSLLAVNASRCKPPLEEHEVKTIAYSARWEAQDPIGTPKGDDPWRLMATKDIFAELGPYPWLIQGIHLAPGRITLLNGYADVGKTVIAMSIALTVATGRPLWGVFRPARTGKVLHLNGEIGSYIARERYQRMARGMGVDVPALIESGALTLANYPAIRLDDKDFEDKLALVCEGYQFVVVDSLRAFSGSLDEKSKEIGVALFMLAQVSERTGATIMVLHHNRKPSKDDIGGAKMAISGSGAILGGAECAFVMTSTEKGGPILVEHERSPIGRPMANFGLSIEDVALDGDPRWGLRVVHLEEQQLEAFSEAAQSRRDGLETMKATQAIQSTLERYAGAYRGSKEGFRAAVGIGKAPFLKALSEMVSNRVVRQGGSYHQPEFFLESMTHHANPD